MSRWSFALAASLLALCAPLHAELPDPADPNLPRLKKLLATTPLIDGHNDWAETLTGRAGEKRWTMDLTRLDPVAYDTDIERLRQGMVGGQFWSVFVSPALPGPEQVKETLEQIDLIKSIVRRYPNDFVLARTAADVIAARNRARSPR